MKTATQALGVVRQGSTFGVHPGKEVVEMGESRTPRPETFAGDHYERVR
jgi:hypothetical protein